MPREEVSKLISEHFFSTMLSLHVAVKRLIVAIECRGLSHRFIIDYELIPTELPSWEDAGGLLGCYGCRGWWSTYPTSREALHLYLTMCILVQYSAVREQGALRIYGEYSILPCKLDLGRLERFLKHVEHGSPLREYQRLHVQIFVEVCSDQLYRFFDLSVMRFIFN